MNSCQNCIFATFIKSEEKYTPSHQYGCHLNKLDVYGGYKLDGRMFFDLNRYCYYHRDFNWYEKHKNEDPVDVVEQENILKYAVLIFDSPEIDLGKAIDDILQFSIPPTYLEIFASEQSLAEHDVYNKIKQVRKWTIRSSLNDETNNLETCITSYIHNGGNYPFTLILTKNTELSKTKMEEISKAIKDDGLLFNFMDTNDMGAILIPTPIIKVMVLPGFSFKQNLLEHEEYDGWTRLSL